MKNTLVRTLAILLAASACTSDRVAPPAGPPSSDSSAGAADPAARWIFEGLRASAQKPWPTVYPQLLEVAGAIFDPPAVEIRFRTTETERGVARTIRRGTIWYSRGRVFVEHEPVPGEEEQDNYATIGDELVSWPAGGRRGVSFDRGEGDVAMLVWYLVDPSAIKAGTYFEVLEDPGSFDTEPSGARTTYSRREREDPVWRSLEVIAKPLWFPTLRYRLGDDAPVYEMVTEPPRVHAALPARLSRIADGVRFEREGNTVDARLKYI